MEGASGPAEGPLHFLSLNLKRSSNEQSSVEFMDASTSNGRASIKRNRSPVVDLSTSDSPAPLVWDPDNDLGNIMRRNKRYLSEVMANDLSRHMTLDSSPTGNNTQHRSHSSSVSPPLPMFHGPNSPTSLLRGTVRSPSMERLRSPTPDAISSDSMDATPADGMNTEADTQSRNTALTAPKTDLGQSAGLPPTGRLHRPSESICRPTPILHRTLGARDLPGGLAQAPPSSISSNYDFLPGSPTDLRTGFDLRKTALLRSLLNRAEDVSNLMVSDDSALCSSKENALTRNPQEPPLVPHKPRRYSAAILMGMPQVPPVPTTEVVGSMLVTGCPQLNYQPPAQAGFSRMNATLHPSGSQHLDPANSASMENTSSSSSSEDHRLGMPPGKSHELCSTAVSASSLFPPAAHCLSSSMSLDPPEQADEGPTDVRPPALGGFSGHVGTERELSEWQIAQVRAKAIGYSSVSLEGEQVGHADVQLVGMMGGMHPGNSGSKSTARTNIGPH